MGVLDAPAFVPKPKLYRPDHLIRWRAAMGDALFAQPVISCIGHSIVFGKGSGGTNTEPSSVAATAGWVGRLRTLLAKTYGDTGMGYVTWVGAEEDRVTLGGSPSSSQRAPFARGRRLQSGQTWTQTINGTGFRVMIWQDATSTTKVPTWSVDGGADETPTQTSGDNTMLTVSKTGLTDGPHTVVLKGPATGSTYIAAVRDLKGTSGVVVNGFGLAGTVVNQSIVGTGTPITDAAIQDAILQSYWTAPGTRLGIIEFLTNDQAAQTPIADWKAATQRHIDKAVAAGACVLLLADPANSAAVAGITRQQYEAALVELTDQDHVAAVSISEMWGTYAQANALGLYNSGSTVHPSARGYGDIAQLLHNIVTNRALGGVVQV